jgi:hypothetical protein
MIDIQQIAAEKKALYEPGREPQPRRMTASEKILELQCRLERKRERQERRARAVDAAILIVWAAAIVGLVVVWGTR